MVHAYFAEGRAPLVQPCMTCERRAPSRSTALDRACFHLCERTADSSCTEMAKTPTPIWAQRVEKVFVTWECLSTKDVNVPLSEGLLTVEGAAVAKWQMGAEWGAASGERGESETPQYKSWGEGKSTARC